MKTATIRRLVGVLALASMLLAGCATYYEAGTPMTADSIRTLNGAPDNLPYRLVPGDKIAIKFFYNKDLNDEVTVRPDGKIALQLVDEVVAAGRTPQELADVLTVAYAKAFGTNPNTYVLGIGEKLSIKSFYHDKLNEDVVIRPDGKVSMQLVGEVQAAGLAPGQLAATISERLKRFIDTPDVAVIVRDFRRPELSVIVRETAGQRVFVGGEVKSPSVIPYVVGMGLMSVTMQAGGTLDSALLDNVLLWRPDAKREPAVYSVNVTKIVRGEMPDVMLRPYDVVFVPKSPGAETAAWLRANVYNLLPPQFSAYVGYQVNPAVAVQNK